VSASLFEVILSYVQITQQTTKKQNKIQVTLVLQIKTTATFPHPNTWITLMFSDSITLFQKTCGARMQYITL
jgi:hypothetical protein